MAEIEFHLHPFIEKNSIIDIVQAMDSRNLDILAMESLDNSLFSFILEKTKEIYPGIIYDQSGIRLSNGKYFLKAREYNTKENLHILTVGYSMDDAVPKTEIRKIIDNGLNNEALVLLDHPFVDNGKTKTAGHISVELEQELEKICREYSGAIALEWNGYCIPWIRQILKFGLNTMGFDMKYYDVNQRAEELSNSLKEQGYNVPIIADTDLHTRKRRYLNYLGTARIITDVDGETPKEILNSIKKNIFQNKHKNIKRYVPASHLLEAFCLPILLPQFFNKPRA